MLLASIWMGSDLSTHSRQPLSGCSCLAMMISLCESAPSLDPFRRRMLTLPYRPIIVSAECPSKQAPGSLLQADWGSNSTPIHTVLLGAASQ
jgi:hypothetical protein